MAGLGLVLLATACDRPGGDAGPEAPATSEAVFRHRNTADVSGYYLPNVPVRMGDLQLHHLFMAGDADFTDWEGGARRYSPIHLVFDDVTSPIQAPETSQGHAVQVRVQPGSYEVSDGRVRFEGTDARLGRVVLDARLDADALAQARRAIGSGRPVLNGSLTAGGRSMPVQMTWFGGD